MTKPEGEWLRVSARAMVDNAQISIYIEGEMDIYKALGVLDKAHDQLLRQLVNTQPNLLPKLEPKRF